MKKTTHFIIGLFIASFTLFTACDKISSDVVANDGKELPGNGNAGTDTTSTDTTATEVRMRKILIEDFTGHECPNCPRAALEIKTIEDLYGEKVVAMALHVSETFAAPVPPEFPADYRTTEGTAIDNFFGISSAGLPKGMVNRRGFQGQHIFSYFAWSTEVSNLVNLPLDAWIGMTNTYNATLNQVTTDLKIDFETSIIGDVKVCAFLVQDSIISPQKDNTATGGKNLNYVHNHMLKKGLTPAFGEIIATDPTASTPAISKTYSLVLLPEWKPEHCKIIAYIYKASNYEIIQVQEKKVK